MLDSKSVQKQGGSKSNHCHFLTPAVSDKNFTVGQV